MTKPNLPMAERLDNVMLLTECGCHIWMGCTGDNGYGQIKIKGKMVRTHRASWELANGPIPEGLDVLHTCDIEPCINPDHLYAGTHQENMADKAKRNRHSGGKYGTKISEDIARFIKISRDPNVVLSKRFGLSESSVSRIKSGKNWKYVEVATL